MNMSNVDEFGLCVATRGVPLMTKAGTTQEIANIALFLASEDSSILMELQLRLILVGVRIK